MRACVRLFVFACISMLIYSVRRKFFKIEGDDHASVVDGTDLGVGVRALGVGVFFVFLRMHAGVCAFIRVCMHFNANL